MEGGKLREISLHQVQVNLAKNLDILHIYARMYSNFNFVRLTVLQFCIYATKRAKNNKPSSNVIVKEEQR